MMTFLMFAVGATAGSVANAVTYRLPRRISWWSGNSICPKCKHQLAWYDLIPLLSYLMLGGKCRYCRKPISWRYFLVEIFLGLSFVVINSHSWSYNSLILSAILWISVVIAVMDWETMLVSDWLVGSWLVLVLISMNYELITMNLIGTAVATTLIGGIWAVSRGKAMGFGDVEIAAVFGLWLGWPKVAPALWISFVAGAVVGIWYLAVGKKRMKSRIAFGPFLILGGWLAYLIQWKYVLPF